ncbi:MAG: response regulator, partial [Acidobacteriota bacterium]
MDEPLSVLIVEDSEDDALLLVRYMERGGLCLRWERVETQAALREALVRGGWNLVISDYRLPAFDGLQALDILKDSGLDIPFLLVSGSIGEERAVEAMRRGAADYIFKDNLARLLPAVQRELREAEGRRKRREAEAAQKALEERLKEAEKLETIGMIAGGVAHEVRNPLFALQTVAAALHQKLGGREEYAEY